MLRQLASAIPLLAAGTALAGDVHRERNEVFLNALLAGSRHDSIPAEMDLYAPLLGNWTITGTEYVKEGHPRKVVIDVSFARALDGRAIQDIWIWPIDSKLPFAGANRGYGTTLRIYDAVERIWNVTWLNPVDRARAQLIGRKVGRDIVQIGANAAGHPRRWVFSEITDESFIWRGEHSDDGGRTWKLNAEYFGKRVRT